MSQESNYAGKQNARSVSMLKKGKNANKGKAHPAKWIPGEGILKYSDEGPHFV